MIKDIPFSLKELSNIKDKYDTPYYIYDGDNIRKNALLYMNSFKKYFPGFKQFFAVKATPNPSILSLLSECGMDFDCSSPNEIKVVNMTLKYNFQKANIFYTSNFTSTYDLEYAIQNNCIINLDDLDGIYNITKYKIKLPETICFRYNPIIINNNVDIKSNIFNGNETKFGMTINRIIRSYLIAKSFGVKHFGLHTMCISNQLDISYWKDIIDNIFILVNKLYNTYDIKIEFINIGGGLGIPYKPEERPINIEDFAKSLRDLFDYNINKFDLDFEPTLFTECGRFITGPHGYLVSTCKSIKTLENDDIFYGLDANMANLMRPGMYDAYHHITIPRLKFFKYKKEVNIVGTLCENNDWFAKKRLLPTGINKNDIFVIHDVGAHGHSMGFNYNSKIRSSEIIKINNKIILIRDRENFKDLFGNTLIYKNIRLIIQIFFTFIILCYIILFYFLLS